MPKKLFGFGVVVIILLAIAVLIFLPWGLAGHLRSWGIRLDLHNFELLSFSKDETRVSRVEKLEAISGRTKVFIDSTKISSHEKYVEDKKFLLRSLFEPTTSPYPEVITNVIECPSEFKPKEKVVGNGVVYTLFAGERLNYGVCAHDLVRYNSVYGIFDCKDKGIFEIRIFSDGNNEIERTMKSFKC